MYRKNVRLLSIFNFLIGFTFFAPLAIIYFSQVAGSYALGTSIFGIIMLSAAVFEVPTGILSDKVGRKQTIILGSIFRLFAFIFYALGYSYIFLAVGAVLEGISRSFYSGNNDAFLYDTLAGDQKESEFKNYLGKVSSMEHIGLALSAAIGGFVASFSFSYALYLAVVSQLLLLVISFLFVEPQSTSKEETNIYAHLSEAIRLFKKKKKLRLLTWASILANSFGELAYQFRGAFYVTLWPLWAIGLTNILSNILVSLGLLVSNRVVNKFTSEATLFFKSVLSRAVSLVSLIFPTVFSPLLMSTTSFLYGVSVVANGELKQQEFSNEQRATMDSLISLGRALGAALMTLILGKAADQMGPRNALIMMSLLSFSITYVYWVIYRNSVYSNSNNNSQN